MIKKNIAFFVTSLDSGGIENYLLRFLNEHYENFANIYIVCRSGRAGQLENNYLNLPNVEILRNKISNIPDLTYINLRRILKANRVDIVCDFTGNFSALILMTAYSNKISKRVAFYRGASNHFDTTYLKSTYNLLLSKITKKLATDILSNSKSALDYFYGPEWQSDNRFKVIYNGVNADTFIHNKKDLREELGIPKDAYVIGHTGRFNSAKNHIVIIEVAKKLIRKHKDIFFILCGSNVANNLKDEIIHEGLESRILVFNNRLDIPEFLNTMNCYFFPSLTEGQPNALIEAMIMGLPYVASNISSIKETAIPPYHLHDANDIDSFITTLESLYKRRAKRSLDLQNKAIAKFNHNKNFNNFLEVLIN